MITRAIRCANCSGAVRFAAGSSRTVCEYCGVQVLLGGGEPAFGEPEPTGPRLATSIGVKVTPTLTIPLLTAGTAVPAQHHETLSTQRDDQESITIELEHAGRTLVNVVFPIAARGPRGTVMVQLLVKVDGTGLATVFVTERGTTNTTKREGLRVQLQS
ncbi:MAG: hypothetical protein JNK04_26485 [Myxococcales bacterium]|nr:hypothetical protein [Myxococcales bacterium]